MSDGFTDAARGERRQECDISYYTAIQRFLLDNTEPNREAVRNAAKVSDHADRNWDERRSKEATSDALLDGLVEGDEHAWANVLESTNGLPVYDDLLPFSPFRFCVLIFGRRVRYGSGMELDTRQLERFVDRLSSTAKLLADAQDSSPKRFCIALPNPEPGMLRILVTKE